MKMKRALKCIGAVALAVSLMMVPSMIPVQASNGPCMEGEFAFANIQLNDTVVFSTNEKNTVDGASYDQASNTLTLTNYDHPDVALYTNMMGDDFKLNLVGSNKLQNLGIWHGGWGGSLTICGSGSLTVNENRKNPDGIELFAEGGKSLLTVSGDSTVTVYRGTDGCPFGSSWNYTSSPIVAKGQVNDMKIQAEHPFEMIQVYGGYFGTDISPVQSDVYTKTGEEGRFVITEITDMSGNKTYRIEKLQECTTMGAEVAITVEDKLTDISAYTANGEIAAYYSTTMVSGGSDACLVKKQDTGDTFIYRRTYYEAGNSYRILCPILMSYTDYNTQETRYLMDAAHPVMKELVENMALAEDTLPAGYEFEGKEVENVYNVYSGADVISFTPKQVVVNGVVDVTDGDTAISDNGFRQILAENQTKDIVIKSNDELSFTFGKGTMSAIDNVSSYDFGVKIVKDYSELGTLPSAVNKNILSTNKGYVLYDPSEEIQKARRTIAVSHSDEQTQDELYTIVDFGGKVLDVVIEHDIYGQITVDLILKSRQDVDEFIAKVAKSKAKPLKTLTGNKHFHTVEADSEQLLDIIEEKLREKGYAR
mgnify:CR=1 FL=1